MEKSGGVTSEMLDCSGLEMKRQDKRLNGAYQKLMATASDAQKAALRDSQRLWLAYRKTNCDLVYRFGGGGTLDSLGASSCELDTLSQRVKFLENLSPS
ncbi:lysozyme inhibitor LprI family protein [Methylobacterium trifolii]